MKTVTQCDGRIIKDLSSLLYEVSRYFNYPTSKGRESSLNKIGGMMDYLKDSEELPGWKPSPLIKGLRNTIITMMRSNKKLKELL